MSEIMPTIYLSIVSFFAWIVSTLAGGGSPFVLIPLVNLLMGAASVPPVITIGMFFGNAHRVLLFWRDIDWKLTAWYAPGAVLGAILGAYTFTRIHIDGLQIVIGIFLLISAVLFELEKSPDTKNVANSASQPDLNNLNNLDPDNLDPDNLNPDNLNPDNLETKLTALAIASEETSDSQETKEYGKSGVIEIPNANQTETQGQMPKPKFKLEAWHIMPAGFLKAYVSGLVGTTGPVLNPFYLRYGLLKEQMIATKAAHMTIIHVFKLITYGLLAALSQEQAIAGLAIGLAAIPANLVGKYILSRMSSQQFRQIVLVFMAVGGIWMLWGQRNLFLN
ncbi:sulfite exporter TauE/SafE family protein [Pseudanabaena sp. UWO310]|nr:sulfite exporter TauE/SafE family protein [Pseudanabaena sp. UWO310]